MNAASIITLLGALGLFLLGIHHLTEGLKGLAGDSLRRALQRIVSGRFSAVVSGAIFTAVIQSSTAAILTVIGFVSAGLAGHLYPSRRDDHRCDARNNIDDLLGGDLRPAL